VVLAAPSFQVRSTTPSRTSWSRRNDASARAASDVVGGFGQRVDRRALGKTADSHQRPGCGVASNALVEGMGDEFNGVRGQMAMSRDTKGIASAR
jgi:hypothetical protein